MRALLWSILLTGSVFTRLCFPLDFKVTSVVPIGPIYSGGLTEPARWSPDGTKLAYFSDDDLMIADTLGNTGPVVKIDLPPHRFVWASDTDILVYQWQQFRDSVDNRLCSHNRLIAVNIETGSQTTLEEFIHRAGDKSENLPGAFKGPYLTIEGNPFYFIYENGKERIQMAPGLPEGKASLTRNSVLRPAIPRAGSQRGESDALYLVRADLKDSIKISNRYYEGYLGRPVSLSPDTTHIMFGGVIVRLADDKMIVLDTLIQDFPRPEGTRGCGFVEESFNPRFTEVAFTLSCDDGHDYIVNRIGVFDYQTNEFTILDSLINLTDCRRPAYASDGKRIFFTSQGVSYYLNREVNNGENSR